MKTNQLFLILLIAVFFSLTVNVFSQVKPTESFKEMEIQILKLVNEHRKSIGLCELEFSKAINDEALQHSMNMANCFVPFSHNGFEGRVNRLMKQIGANAIAENLATGQTRARKVLEDWLNSKDHKQNIEGRFDQTGIGIAQGKDGHLYFTQIFLLCQKEKSKEDLIDLIFTNK